MAVSARGRAGGRLPVVGTTRVIFSAEQAGAALWTYGEDALIERAMAMTIDELAGLWQWAGENWRVDHDLPLQSRLTLDKIAAFAAIVHLEGSVRPLARERRRPVRGMPESLRNAPSVPIERTL